ncbi:methylase [Listeria aquatica FSL S10-1188]|uniref:Methylase n=1 Tax=Listeria aquatica FSL S10-1188 TaxID=1265818 RepID=W7B2W9_9LIST|nr:methylase [Listeria aquatica FSL S10-1188]
MQLVATGMIRFFLRSSLDRMVKFTPTTYNKPQLRKQKHALTKLLAKIKFCSLKKSHAELAADVSEPVRAVIYNLGYLPGGDKSITTLEESTLESISAALEKLMVGGLVILVIYHGHEAGKLEKEAILNYVSHLPQEKFSVLQYGFINQRNLPPFVVAIEKR